MLEKFILQSAKYMYVNINVYAHPDWHKKFYFVISKLCYIYNYNVYSSHFKKLSTYHIYLE